MSKQFGKSLILLMVMVLFSAAIAPSSKTKKGFEALEVFNYFAAKDYFFNALKRDSLGAGYGLSIIYARKDNPFYQPDSAFRFISVAIRNLENSFPPDSLKYLELGISPAAIQSQKVTIDSIFFALATGTATVEAWTMYLKDHDSQPFAQTALELRNYLAFKAASDTATASAYLYFLETYPLAEQIADARSNYEAAIYSEATTDGKASSFASFIVENPESPYVVDAENQLFKAFEVKNNPNDLYDFITRFPENRNVSAAWRKIYLLEIKQFEPRAIAAFSLKYPDYPFADELQDDFMYAVTPFYPVKMGDKYGFIDDKGIIRIDFMYDWVEPFSENISLVGLSDQVAFLKKDGKPISDFIYDDGFSFHEGFAVVELNGKYGLINRFGQEIIPTDADDMGEMSEGLIYLQRNGLYGYSDEIGDVAIDFQFDEATDFTNGLAVVGRDGLKGLIDRSGRAIGDFRWDWIEPLPESAAVSRARANQLFGLINRLGSLVIDTTYEQIGEFHEGLALAANEEEYGFIDEKGKIRVDLNYTYSSKALVESHFSNGYAKVFQDDRVGLVDTSGRKVLPAMFEDILFVDNGRFAVKKRGKWGYVDATNKVLIDYKYEDASAFEDSVAIISQKSRYTMIDLQDKPISAKYNQLERVNGLYIGGDTALALISNKGVPLTPFIYKEVKRIDDKVIALILENGLTDYFDRSRNAYIWKQPDPSAQ